MTTHGHVAKSMRETIEGLRAEVAQAEGVARGYMLAAERAEAALLDAQHQEAQDIEALGKLEDERDALRSTVHGLSVQLEEGGKEQRALREIMWRLVHGIDNWNASVEPIIGRPVDYKWLALEEARAALAPAEEGWGYDTETGEEGKS